MKSDAMIYRYAGIGSRQTPHNICEQMWSAARRLKKAGWTLRSGHCDEADQAWEAGAGEEAEIYLPWSKYNKDVEIHASLVLSSPTSAAFTIAAKFHPAWKYLRPPVRLLHARNVHIMLGRDCIEEAAVKFVGCWTPDGARHNPTEETGGTGMALRIARHYDIPVYNFANEGDYESMIKERIGI
jgi:hypothetical protein